MSRLLDDVNPDDLLILMNAKVVEEHLLGPFTAVCGGQRHTFLARSDEARTWLREHMNQSVTLNLIEYHWTDVSKPGPIADRSGVSLIFVNGATPPQ
jgi:hypothetical protein